MSKVTSRHIDRAHAWAARYRAEHSELEQLPEPTDENLRAAFADCARPIAPTWYPLVRAELASWWKWERP